MVRHIRTKPRRAFVVCRGVILWIALVAAALVFTQLLRSPASAILFVFLLLIPPAMLLYLLIARGALKLYRIADDMTVEKNLPFDYAFRLVNTSPLPYPFVDAYVRLPLKNGVRCAERVMRAPLVPLGSTPVYGRVAFPYRGTYEIGVDCIYVYDLFRLFGMRITYDLYAIAYVTPRRRNAEGSDADLADDAAESDRRRINSHDRLEISGVREYRSGDSLKSIHWKLSSRTDEPVVREYNAGRTRTTYIYCDLAAHFPLLPPAAPSDGPFALAAPEYHEDMNELAADGVVELAIAAVLRELNLGNHVVLAWYDRRSPNGTFVEHLDSPAAFDRIWNRFASSPLCSPEYAVTRLAALRTETVPAKQIFVTAYLSSEMLSSLTNSPADTTELLFYNPSARYADPRVRRAFLDQCAEQLAGAGVGYVECTE